ncbi:MAG: efflux RND transporter permease subunit [Sedimentisphaerales bacterium]|nr:efflux RND transporter permease subunit [Sedimentisphaerales bacterium]
MESNPQEDYSKTTPEQSGLIGRLIRFCLVNRLVILLLLVLTVVGGYMVAPFDWSGPLPRDPVAVDAIPDIGENQQIVFSAWPGRSPQDVEDQITYPLTVSLLGVPGVRTIRSKSMFGFSLVQMIFDEDVDFYWSRSRILEKLNSLPVGLLPEGVSATLGPDATALGQIFWYTLEGRDPEGNPIGGWDLEQLRTIQDWYVRYGLLKAQGVSEVASVGGFVREYQVDIDPDIMRVYGVTLPQVEAAVANSNIDVGAGNIELNGVEYLIRGRGFIDGLSDIEESVITSRNHIPITVGQVSNVSLGPAVRRGALDKDGAETVGAVVVARYGANPLEVINNVKEAIAEITPSLPVKVVIDNSIVRRTEVEAYAQAAGFEAYVDDVLNQGQWLTHLRSLPREEWPRWVNTSQVTIVPFYDRTGLIHETLGTLSTALTGEILITLVVVIVMLLHLRSSLVVGSMLPLSVLLCFLAMKVFGVDANIVSLSGIAIAIGTIVDMGIVVCENVVRRLEEAPDGVSRLEVIHRGSSEVGGAVLTAVATTVISFLPVFFMSGASGKLFRPLAFTKTFALIASIILALTVIPPAIYVIFGSRTRKSWLRYCLYIMLAIIAIGVIGYSWRIASTIAALAGLLLLAFAAYKMVEHRLPTRIQKIFGWLGLAAIVVLLGLLLSGHWQLLGAAHGELRNFIAVALMVGMVLLFFKFYQSLYPRILNWCLRHKKLFLSFMLLLILFGAFAWLGFRRMMSPVSQLVQAMGVQEESLHSTSFWIRGQEEFPGLGRELMPPLDEGSFLFMPTTMVHASIGEVLDIMSQQDRAFRAIPEVESVVGKLGRAETALDPAPISMIETVINYKSEYITDANGRRVLFRYDQELGDFVRDESGQLIQDDNGRPFRQWRDHIHTPDDIWREITQAGHMLGVTGAPPLQPIAARLVMLQSGMRSPMGVRIQGSNLQEIEEVGLQIERFLREVPQIDAATVNADRVVGKPYLEIEPSREALARYGIEMQMFQRVLETAIGGRTLTNAVMGRERFGVRVRYQRELRDNIEAMNRILVPAMDGTQIPLSEVAEIRYVRGPQVIRGENTFPVGYVLFDKLPGYAEVDVVEAARQYLDEKRAAGELVIPAGITFVFAGTYEAQLQARRVLMIVLPLALLLIFLILYLQFRRMSTTLLTFSGILVAWSGGFILLWMYSQDWFLNLHIFGVSLRETFQVHQVHLSVAVWVGFLALFGIATDDGVVQCTYLEQLFRDRKPQNITEVRDATLAAGKRRIRPCLMTTATTVLALLPVLTSQGRGSDVMVPMAIPSFGGMLVALLSILVVPVLYCWIAERQLQRH